jgi:hypothetical protein
VRDGLPNHWRESYFRENGKSMKAGPGSARRKNC